MRNFKPNDGVHIDRIMQTTTCLKHEAVEGIPCWDVWLTSKQAAAPAICGTRIKTAGFDGLINPTSLRLGSVSRSPKVGSQARSNSKFN